MPRILIMTGAHRINLAALLAAVGEVADIVLLDEPIARPALNELAGLRGPQGHSIGIAEEEYKVRESSGRDSEVGQLRREMLSRGKGAKHAFSKGKGRR